MTIDVYREQRGEKPYRVTLIERPEKGLTLWLRWYVGGKPRYELTRTKSIRDSRGRVQARAIQKAQAEADQKIAELRGDVQPGAKRRTGPLTLREGVDLAFSARGPYPHDPTEDEWTKAAKGYADDAIRLLVKVDDQHRDAEELTWDDVTPGMVRSVWRQLEREFRSTGGGANRAQKTLIVFYRISGWLQGEFPDQRFPAPLRGWRGELKAYWKKQGHETASEQPRHTPEEIAAIYSNRHRGDPRVRLALAIGGRLRGGQVIRTMRSHYDPEKGIPMRRGALGQIDIPYVSEKKKAPRLYLNWRERLELERALRHGVLSELEEAYRMGTIKDYPLFPGGKLRKGKAPRRARLIPMHKTSIAGIFHDLERLAGVTPVRGRGWHGLRRGFTDLDETVSADERVKERLGGWTPGSKMRKRVYQKQESEAVDTEAAQARAKRHPGGAK